MLNYAPTVVQTRICEVSRLEAVVNRVVMYMLLLILLLQLAGVGTVGFQDTILGSAFKQGYEWIYSSVNSYLGSEWNETVIYSVVEAGRDRYVVREAVFYEGESSPYNIQLYYLNSDWLVVRVEQLYIDYLAGTNESLIIEYENPIPFVFWPSGKGDQISGESHAIVYNGSNGEQLYDVIVKYNYRAVDEVTIIIKDRVVPFMTVEGSISVYDALYPDEPFYTIDMRYYINNDLLLPLIHEINDSDGFSAKRVLEDYTITPDPLEKYPPAEYEQPEAPTNYSLSLVFVVEGNYTKSLPLAYVEVYSANNELLYKISFAPESVVKLELPQDTYILRITPSEGYTEDNIGMFYFKNWVYKGKTVTTDTLQISLSSNLEIKIVMVVYYIPPPVETTTETVKEETTVTTTPETTTIIETGGTTTKPEEPETPKETTIPSKPETGTTTETIQEETSTDTTTQAPGEIGITTTRQQNIPAGGAPGVVPPVEEKEEPFYKSTAGMILIAVAIIATSAGALYAFKFRGGSKRAYQPPVQLPPQPPIVESERREPQPPRSTMRYPAIPPPQQQPPQAIPIKRSKKKCPYCGAEIPLQAKYCPRCGSPQP